MAETYEGFDGYVMTVDNVFGGINHWALRLVQETLETSRFDPTATALARRFRRFKPGPLSWTATFDGFVMPTDAGQIEIKDAINNGSEISAYFHLDGDRYYAGKGLMTLENPDLAWDGVGTTSFDMQGTEACTRYGWEE